MSIEILYTNATIATMANKNDYGLINDGAVGITDGQISYVGKASDAPNPEKAINCFGKLITPALIDCHTHLIYGGNRANEFESRLNGISYEEIAKAGGGIISTVKATRAASEEELIKTATDRLDHLIAEGVATVEIKSGYGLDIENEIKMLRTARKLAAKRNVRVKSTFLGAHALPPEFSERSDEYIDFICDEMLPKAHSEGLVDAVDGFCESIGFSVEQMKRVFNTAKKLGLPVKLHAEQISYLGGANMAASFNALSADHLEYLEPKDCVTLTNNSTVAVLLPSAFYYLRETTLPPIKALREAKTDIAIATDSNPGSSPNTSLLLTMNMACTLFNLTPEEALRGCTINAAKALGLENEIGSIELNKKAELAIWNVNEPAELSYRMGHNPLYKRIIGENL